MLAKTRLVPSPDKHPDFVTFEMAVSNNKKRLLGLNVPRKPTALAKVVKSYVKKGMGF